METVAVLRLGNTRIALKVSQIERVLRAVAITPVPNQSAGVLGVINVEGVLTKVSDIRARLGLEPKELELEDQIVIVETNGQKVAIVVDAVQMIMHFEEDQFMAFADAESSSALGVLRIDDEMVIVCNPQDFLSPLGSAGSAGLAGQTKHGE